MQLTPYGVQSKQSVTDDSSIGHDKDKHVREMEQGVKDDVELRGGVGFDFLYLIVFVGCL